MQLKTPTSSKTFLSLFFICFIFSPLIAQISPFIHVDQFGYTPNAEKIAVLSDPQSGYNSNLSYTPSSNIELRSATNDQVMATLNPTQWNNGNTHGDSGDRGWWLDFSVFNTPGTYYLIDVAKNERSATFEISDDPYGAVLKSAVRMFYYNRCNLAKVAPYAEGNWTDAVSFTNPLQDTECRFIEQPNNAALEKELTGGWFDAGDYNKYVTFTVTTIHNLLAAYQENPAVFTDNYNIPESGNGIPDLLDEIKWELDWLIKMNNPDGSTHIKMGSINYLNGGSPPSQNFDQRYYGPTCSSASISIASIFSHAAFVLKDIPALQTYANTLEQKAITSWNYVLPLINSNNLDENCDDGTINSGDADLSSDQQKAYAFAAAVHLFNLTGSSTYQNYIENNYSSMEPLTTGFWGINNMPLVEALLAYADMPQASSAAKTAIQNSFQTTVNNNWNGFFGFNADDLYRAYMPNWSYDWGSSSSLASYGVLNLLINKYGYNQGNPQSYEKDALERLHCFHGVNPQGMVYLSNMYSLGADRSVNQIYHGWFADGTDYDDAQSSLYGPPPGFVTGGPNAFFTINTISPPHGQPNQKCYLDFNDDWPNNSWEISEPAIYYQAAFVRLASAFVENQAPLGVDWLEPLRGKKVNAQHVLSWITADEFNNDFFSLERSGSNQDWQEIKKIKAAGNQGSSYQAVDNKPLEGANYYRLRQIDFDGTESFSNTIVLYNDNDLSFSIFPNPAQSVLNYNTKINKGLIQIFGLNGQVLIQSAIESTIDQINIKQLPAGSYYLKVTTQNNSDVIYHRFIKT